MQLVDCIKNLRIEDYGILEEKLQTWKSRLAGRNEAWNKSASCYREKREIIKNISNREEWIQASKI